MSLYATGSQRKENKMSNLIVEFLKLNPTATAQWGTTYWKDAILAEMPALEAGIIIDVHGAKVQDIKMPEDCIFVPCLSYEGVDALVKRADGSEATCYIKGIEPISWAKWMDDYYSRFHL